ncbi:hypothetical protein AG1IA_03522 [Rhizoctonia solani AG-1 IA]|uniref:Uncharacterized protein n=1 Tax=Thanatephorus cucumeris (strain AG1-IA) TaxID=983506 RepID=L8X088_THACA|nr:hypothetical protein AG1IA_03522 [Rhizoctonia solani AG-1 IA]
MRFGENNQTYVIRVFSNVIKSASTDGTCYNTFVRVTPFSRHLAYTPVWYRAYCQMSEWNPGPSSAA